MTNIIAMYLPQYHEIEENNKWWGKGFTEWVNMKRAKPFFKNHYQPRVPLNNNYYDLTNEDAQKQQAEWAKKYGVYGFCYYHYWFEGKQILEKPMENMLKNKDIDLKFCISWANHSWENKTQRKNRITLQKQTYGGEEDWKKHFYYLLPFFKDDRYIKVDDKPMLVIYDAKGINCWSEMQKLWNELALLEGLKGIHYVSTLKCDADVNYTENNNFDAQFEYQPTFSLTGKRGFNYSTFYYLKRILNKELLNKYSCFNYDRVWKQIFERTPKNSITTYLGAYTDWDTTPRHGNGGILHYGSSPIKFEKYLKNQIERSKTMHKSDFIFITAWNEWSEGAYLEPDEKFKYGYLEAVKNAISKE